MRLFLTTLSVSNWKGIQSESFQFSDQESSIYGANGSGKSSMFAAFIWLLFGKDQFGRQDHQIKPFDTLGEPIHRLSSEVEATVLIDGKALTLKRVYHEKWVKPKTEPEEIFDGNTTDYYINDISISKKDYDAKVSEICDESVFKSITSPYYFTGLGWKEQREALFGMAESITDEQIAADNADFLSILKEIEGIGFERFKKELNTQKAKVKKECDGINPRIDEHRRSRPAPIDFVSIQAQLNEKEKELEFIEASISDVSKKSEAENKARMAIRSEINKLEQANQQIGFIAQSEKNKEIESQKSKIRNLTIQIGDKQRDEKTKRARLDYLIPEKARLSSKKDELIKEYNSIKARQLTFEAGFFDCPTCHRPLDVSDIESKQAHMTESFNQEKAELTASNVSKGKALAAQIKLIDDEITEVGKIAATDVSGIEKEIAAIKEAIEGLQSRNVDYTEDEQYKQNLSKIQELKLSLDSSNSHPTDGALTEQKKELKSIIRELNEKLVTKSAIEKTDARIAELERQYKSLNQEISDLEQKEYTIKQFEFAKNKEYETRINSMFNIVRFRLFKTQVDGQIVPDCECMVDGTPYSTQNNAMQIAMGLDIINTISEQTNAFAPIWIDNREGVTHIPVMNTQIINLVVDPSQKILTLK